MAPRVFRAQTPLQALLVEHALLLARDLEHAADTAPDGRVLAQLEARAVPAARELARVAVQHAAQAQAAGAEKKGPPAAAAPTAAGRPPTRGTRPVTC